MRKNAHQPRVSRRLSALFDVQQSRDLLNWVHADLMDAERLYERRWAITLLNRVMDRLHGEFAQAGKAHLFEPLQPFLVGEKSAITYAELAPSLGMTENAVKVTVHRMRQRYRELLYEEVADTVAEPGEVEEELRHLFAVISG